MGKLYWIQLREIKIENYKKKKKQDKKHEEKNEKVQFMS